MNSNKIKNTKVGDDIHFYINGVEDRGIVVKMNNEYVTVFKESTQNYDDIHINDTFFVKDIMVNKEWDKCTDQERFDMLQKAHAPSPRYIMKSWDELPRDIKEVLRKNNGIETAHKDDDDMNTVTRIFDGKTETTKGEGGTGRKISPESSSSEDPNQAPDHKQGEKHRKDTVATMPKGGIADEHGGHRGVTSEESAKLERHNQHGDSNVRNQEVGNRKEKLEWERSGHGSSAAAQDLHNENKPDAVETRQEKQRGRESQDKKGKEVLAGVSALKAWQLWLAKREEQVLKRSADFEEEKAIDEGKIKRGKNIIDPQFEKDEYSLSTALASKSIEEQINKDAKDGKQGGIPKEPREIYDDTGKKIKEPDSTQQSRAGQELRGRIEDAGSKLPEGRNDVRHTELGVDRYHESVVGHNKKEYNQHEKDKKGNVRLGQRGQSDFSDTGSSSITSTDGQERDNKGKLTGKSIEEKLLELKSNVENSVHGNAARNPTSGVSTSTPFDAPKDYEGFSHSGKREGQFKHEKKKPSVGQKLSKVNIKIDGSENPTSLAQGTGENGNEYVTAQQNKDKKGRADNQMEDKKQ